MKRIFILHVVLLLMVTACQKNTVEPYTLKFYGDTREDIGYSVAIAPDGYVIAGQMEIMSRQNDFIIDSLSNKQMAVLKTGWDGNVIWKVITGGKNADMGAKVYQLSDGSVICVGTYTDTISDASLNRKKEVFAVKIDRTGQVLWKKTYGGKGNQTGKDIAESTNGFMILGTTDHKNEPVTDSTGNPEGNTDLYILKISSSGDSLDSYQRGFPGNETASAIKQDLDGNFVVLGSTDMSPKGSGMAKKNLLVLKLGSGGDIISSKITGNEDDEYSSGLEVLQDGYLIAGTIGDPSTSQQAYIVKMNKDIQLQPVFRKKFTIKDPGSNTSYSTAVNSINTYPGGNFLVGGYVNENPGLRMLVFEIDGSGDPVEGKVMIKGSTGDQIVNDVVSGDDGYIIAVGRNTYEVNSMISLLKFRF